MLASDELAAILGECWPVYGHVKVEYRELEIGNIKSIVSVLDDRRVENAHAILSGYRRAGVAPFLPVVYRDRTRREMIALGVIAERHAREYVLLDGTNRCFVAHSRGLPRITAAVVRAQHMPPPAGEVFDLVSLRVSPAARSEREVFSRFRKELFRPMDEVIQKVQRSITGQQEE
jgi:hypothetical protein